MNKPLSETFFSLMMAEMQCKQDPTRLAAIKANVETKRSSIIQIAHARMTQSLPNAEWSPLFLILIDALSAGSPGNAVMWAAYAVGHVRNGKPATVQAMAEQFPIGFPIEGVLHAIWDGQKSESGHNLIDSAQFWI